MFAAFAGFCGGAGFVAAVLFLAFAVCTVNVWAGHAAELAVAVGWSVVATYGPCAVGRGIELVISGLRRPCQETTAGDAFSVTKRFPTEHQDEPPFGAASVGANGIVRPANDAKASRTASLGREPAAWHPSYWAADEWVRPAPVQTRPCLQYSRAGGLASPPSGSSRYPSSLPPPASRPPPSRWVECAVLRALAVTSNAHFKE